MVVVASLFCGRQAFEKKHYAAMAGRAPVMAAKEY